MKTDCRTLAILGMILLACLVPIESYGSMGGLEDEWISGGTNSRRSTPKTLSVYVDGVTITLNPDPASETGDYPLTVELPVTFQGNLQAGQRWKARWEYSVNLAGEDKENVSVTRTFLVPDPPMTTHTVEPNPSSVHPTYPHVYTLWGDYQVWVTIYRYDSVDEKYCRVGELSTTITVNLPEPDASDLNILNLLTATLTANGGMRDLIAASPRAFQLGVAEYEAFEIDARLYDRRACPLTDEGLPECEGPAQYATSRNWGCNHSENCKAGSSYCNSGAKALDPPSYLVLPLSIPEVAAYIAADFNAISTEGAFSVNTAGRKANLETDGSLSPDICLAFAQQRIDFAEANGMEVVGSTLAHKLPLWAGFTQKYGYDGFALDAGEMQSFLSDYITDVVTANAGSVTTWPVANEILNSDFRPTSDTLFRDLILVCEDKVEEDVYGIRWRDLWPWYGMSDKNDVLGPKATDGTVAALEQFYRDARAADPDAKLMYNDWGTLLRYQGTPQDVTDTYKYAQLQKFTELMQEDDVPLDQIGFQTHIAAWRFLTPDGAGGIRLNPNQLKSARNALYEFGKRGYEAIITEMDLLIGIPYRGSGEWGSLVACMTIGDVAYPELWADLSIAERQKWQGIVYEALLNACLAEPSFVGVHFWQIEDQYNWLDRRRNPYNWPHMPRYLDPVTRQPNPASAQPGLFGDNPSTTPCEVYWPKPAYWGVRRAIENYFGPAYSVSDGSTEVLRFAANGNVLLMGFGAQVWEYVTQARLAELDNSDAVLVVRNASDYLLLVRKFVNAEGNTAYALELAGEVVEYSDPASVGCVYKIVGCDGSTVVAGVDADGNLLMKGYLLSHGIPDCLKGFMANDKYFGG